jgi:hypothetical protein
MKSISLIFGSALASLVAFPASAQFSGQFELGPPGCQQKGQCTLTFNLLFRDPQGVEWQADAKNKTDGASIPPWAQPFVGNPFDPTYIKAAVIHDHYCDRHVRPWRSTHRVFYDALLALGVETAKAKLMYYAVYLGGPKWVKLIAGKPCGTGGACTNEVQINGLPNLLNGGDHFIKRAAQYEEPGFSAELAEVFKLLSANSANLTLEDLQGRARKKRPDDFFYRNQAEISLGAPLQTK